MTTPEDRPPADAWAAQVRADEAARQRGAATWEQRARRGDATMSARLLDLVEHRAEVAVTTCDGRVHRGTVVGVGPDVVHLRLGDGGPLLLVPSSGVAAVRATGRREPSSREDGPPRTGSLRDALDTLAADRARVVAASLGPEPTSGAIAVVGQDVVVLSVGDDEVDLAIDALCWILCR